MPNYEISLRGQGQEKITIDEQEYQEIIKQLNQAKLFRLKSGMVINAMDIKKIEPLAQQLPKISKEFRLPTTATEDEKERELKQIKVIKNMNDLFDKMQAQGMFKGFSSYQDWEEKKYGKKESAKEVLDPEEIDVSKIPL